MRKFSVFNATLIVSFALLISGCAAYQDVADPKRITLKDALVDTVEALEAAHQKSVDDHTHFGYYGCSITTVFNVGATGGQDNKLALTASSPPGVIPISIGGSASTESTASGTRGNTVTVVLATPYCLPDGKVAGASRVKKAVKDPDPTKDKVRPVNASGTPINPGQFMMQPFPWPIKQ